MKSYPKLINLSAKIIKAIQILAFMMLNIGEPQFKQG